MCGSEPWDHGVAGVDGTRDFLRTFAALTGNGDADINAQIAGIDEWGERSHRSLACFPALERVPRLSSVNTLRSPRTGPTDRVVASESHVWSVPKRDLQRRPSVE